MAKGVGRRERLASFLMSVCKISPWRASLSPANHENSLSCQSPKCLDYANLRNLHILCWRHFIFFNNMKLWTSIIEVKYNNMLLAWTFYNQIKHFLLLMAKQIIFSVLIYFHVLYIEEWIYVCGRHWGKVMFLLFRNHAENKIIVRF